MWGYTDQPSRKKRICTEIIRDAHETISEMYDVSLGVPKVEFSNRMTSSSGCAKFKKGHNGIVRCVKIVLSIPYMTECWKDFVNDTPKHEAAHSIAVQIHGWKWGKGHGRYWQEIMRDLGVTPSRFHQMQLK